MVRIVNGTKGLWDEWSMVRMVYTWYEKSVVRIVNGMNSPVTALKYSYNCGPTLKSLHKPMNVQKHYGCEY